MVPLQGTELKSLLCSTLRLGLVRMLGQKRNKRVFVCGVGMTKFEKPGRRDDFDYPEMAKEAGTKALQDAAVSFSDIEQAAVGYVYGDSTCGQRAVYELGITGIPVFNVNNNCATGSSALLLAKQMIEAGADCVLALGFEKMDRGSITGKFNDRTSPLDKHVGTMVEVGGLTEAPIAAQIFGNAGREHMQKYGTDKDVFAKIALKNHKHSVDNEVSQFREEYTLDEIKNSKPVFDPLTRLQCCPTSDGGAAAIVCSEEFVRGRGLERKAVEILALEMATDLPSSFEEKSLMKVAGYDMSKKAATAAFQKAGLRPDDVDVVELHDCFSANELITYEALGLAEEGHGAQLVDRSDNTYGGKFVINPSGGLISKGHPLGATGIAQCVEICKQLRGEAGKRQVRNAKLGLQHNLGLGGACVVGLYQLGFPESRPQAPRLRLVNVSQNLEEFKSAVIFDVMAEGMKEKGEEIVKKMKAVFCFDLHDGPGGKSAKWYIDLKNGTGAVVKDATGIKADVTILMKDSDCFDLLIGKMNPQMGFMKGKLKIKGNMGMALKLKDLQKQLGVSDLKGKL